MSQLKILGLCGSLRKGSYNRMLLKLATEVAPADLSVESIELGNIPFFDGDVFDKGYPASAAALRERIRAADGVLIVTPDYNFTLSAVLKNAIDWASRGADQPFVGKPLTVMSATQGPLGGARVQYDVRRIMQFMQVFIMPRPETFVGSAAGKFNAEGQCTDEVTRKFVTEHMAAFRDWVVRMKKLG